MSCQQWHFHVHNNDNDNSSFVIQWQLCETKDMTKAIHNLMNRHNKDR